MRLYLMQLAYLPGLGAPVPGYLVQTDDGQNVLIDTGVPRQALDAPDSFFTMSEEEHVVTQLARIGVTPRDVGYVVSTHYDIDHAGNHDAFPSAEHVVQRAHHEAALAGMARLQGTRPQWDGPDRRPEYYS